MEKNKEFDSRIGQTNQYGRIISGIEKCSICKIDYSVLRACYRYCGSCKHYLITNNKYYLMSDKELNNALIKRGLSTKGIKVQLIARLHNDDDYRKKLKVDLIKELKKRNLDYSGTKYGLIQRLHEYDDKVVEISNIEHSGDFQESEAYENQHKENKREESYSKGSSTKNESNKPEYVDKENNMGKILGLEGKVTKDDIQKAYHVKIKAYHPDKVAMMGDELKELALKKTKEINEAYEYFLKKYFSNK